MQTWQWMVLAVIAVLPFALMSDFWPANERVDSRGVPIPRPWLRQIDQNLLPRTTDATSRSRKRLQDPARSAARHA